MNQPKLHKKTFSEVVNLRNLFLYLVVILLPFMGIYVFIYNLATESYNAEKELITRRLDLQSARLPQFASQEYQLNDIFAGFLKLELWHRSQHFAAAFINHIDELYPDAFAWLLWDAEFRPVPVMSRAMLPGQRIWGNFIKSIVDSDDSSSNEQSAISSLTSSTAFITIKRGLGRSAELDQIAMAQLKTVKINWFDRPAMLIWKHDKQQESGGGMLLMVYLDKLENDFWLRRMVKNLARYQQHSLPVAAVNISQRKVVSVHDQYSDSGFGDLVLKQYLSRSRNLFSFESFIARASIADSTSQIRLISFADISELNEKLFLRLVRARGIIFLLLFLVSYAVFQMYRNPKPGIDMRRRIALIFLIAVFLPIMSLLNIGREFLQIEERRMIESALAEMRADLEGLDLRFGNVVRMVGERAFAGIKDLLGKKAVTMDHLLFALEKSIEERLIYNYVILDQEGEIEHTSWDDMHPVFKSSMTVAIRFQINRELDAVKAESRAENIHNYEVFSAIFEELDFAYEFSRPSRMTLFTFMDENHYILQVTLRIDDDLRLLLIQMPDHAIEQIFAEHEYALNRNTFDESSGQSMVDGKNLIFYSTRSDFSGYPKGVDSFQPLLPYFSRVHELGIEESGQIDIADRGILYLIRSLESMSAQSYIPAVIMPTDDIYQRLDHLSRIFALLVIAAVVGTLLLSFALASSLLTPVSAIDSAVQAVEKGNLDLRLPDMGSDELGRLSQTFNLMIKGLQEREKMEAYVSESVIEAIKANSGDDASEGRDIEATILFSSIRNFTGIIEKYQPDVVFSLLNEFLGGVEPIIRANGGRVDKFIGDAVMAVFLDAAGRHHAEKAVRAAVEIKNFVKNLNYQRQNKSLFSIEIGTGISTGQVMMGDVGSSSRKDLTVIGDEVNLASRLESASRNGRHSRIVISQNTNSFVTNYVVTELMPHSEVKGKKEPVKLFEVVKLRL